MQSFKAAKMSDSLFTRIENYMKTVDRSKPRKVPYVYKFQVLKSGSPYKTWVLDLKNLALTAGDGSAEVTIIIENDVLGQIASKQLSASDAIAQGKVDVEGQVELVLALEPFIAELK